jgi:nitrite reductase/ring-hydroxylating ferredoxin subunit
MSRHTPSDPAASGTCHDCPLIQRRSFLRDGTLILAGILAALGASPALAENRRITLVRALARTGEEHTYPVPAADGVSIDHDAQIILVRFQQRVYAFNLSCPHQNTALKWQPEDTQFQCPKHHSRYRPDGTFISGRATRGMDRLGLRHEGGNIVVDVAKFYRQDQNLAEWNAAFVTL